MIIINQSFVIENITENALKLIELAARNCYKSEDRITDNSHLKMIKKLLNSNHESVLEFASATIRFITDRGVTHELVRHRLCSFAQESTRYVNYKKKEIQFITPVDFEMWSEISKNAWLESMELAEKNYILMLDNGLSPEYARSILPNSLKTEIVVNTNFREWMHIFRLRCTRYAHPQIRDLMTKTRDAMQKRIPLIFDEVY